MYIWWILTLCKCSGPSGGGGGEEGGALEVELLSLHSRLYELETRQTHMAGSEGQGEEAMLQLVMEMSAIQQQVSHMTIT